MPTWLTVRWRPGTGFTTVMGLLPNTQNCGLCMRRECRERFPHHRLQRKLLVSNPGMHHGTCDTHVPWCMSGSLIRGGWENVPGIPGACAPHNFTYLVRGPCIVNERSIPRLHYDIDRICSLIPGSFVLILIDCVLITPCAMPSFFSLNSTIFNTTFWPAKSYYGF